MAPDARQVAAEPTDPAGDRSDRSGRLLYLDNLKIVLTTGVIVAHAAMTYGAAGTWLYEEPALSDVTSWLLGALVGVGAMFGLGLFFLVGGMLTVAPLRRRGPRRFLVSRSWRLGVPLLAYVAIVWPVLRWLTDRAGGDTQSLVDFYRFELTGSRWQRLGSGPLWFVAILLVVTTGWSFLRWARPARTGTGSDPMRARHLVATGVAIAGATFLVRSRFPLDSEQFLDLHVWLWPQSAAMFVLGATARERGWLGELPHALRRGCRRVIVVALLALGAMIVLSDGPEPFKGGWHWEAAGLALFEGAFSVSAAVIVADRFRRRHAAQHRLGRRLARSAYGAFVAQGPVLVLIALAIRNVDVPGDIKFLLLAATAVICSFGLADACLTLVGRLRGRHAELPRPLAD